jgi:hypothetical protein
MATRGRRSDPFLQATPFLRERRLPAMTALSFALNVTAVVTQPLAHPVARSSVSRSCAVASMLVHALGAWGLQKGRRTGTCAL